MRYGEPVVKNLIFNLNEKIENDYLKKDSENENKTNTLESLFK